MCLSALGFTPFAPALGRPQSTNNPQNVNKRYVMEARTLIVAIIIRNSNDGGGGNARHIRVKRRNTLEGGRRWSRGENCGVVRLSVSAQYGWIDGHDSAKCICFDERLSVIHSTHVCDYFVHGFFSVLETKFNNEKKSSQDENEGEDETRVYMNREHTGMRMGWWMDRWMTMTTTTILPR